MRLISTKREPHRKQVSPDLTISQLPARSAPVELPSSDHRISVAVSGTGHEQRSSQIGSSLLESCVYNSSFPVLQTPARLCSVESCFPSADVLTLAGRLCSCLHSFVPACHPLPRPNTACRCGSSGPLCSCLHGCPAHCFTPQLRGSASPSGFQSFVSLALHSSGD